METKPPDMVCKVNWDAAMDVKNKRVGIGVICRNAEGDILACLCLKIDVVIRPVMAEAYALRRAMVFCLELGLSSVILEGDSKVIVNDTNSKEEVWADYGILIEDMRRFLATNSN